MAKKKKKKNTGEWEWLPWEYVAMTGKGQKYILKWQQYSVCRWCFHYTGVCICQTNVHFGYPYLSTVNFIQNTMNTKCIFLLHTKTFYFLKLGKDKFGLHENPPQYPFNYCLHVQGSSVCCFYHVMFTSGIPCGKRHWRAAQRLRHFHIRGGGGSNNVCLKIWRSKP